MKAKLAFISAHGSTYSIRLLCAVLGVARSWFHDWQAGDQARSAESRTEADLVGQIRGIFQDSGERYGVPRTNALSALLVPGLRAAVQRADRHGTEPGPGADGLSAFGASCAADRHITTGSCIRRRRSGPAARPRAARE